MSEEKNKKKPEFIKVLKEGEHSWVEVLDDTRGRIDNKLVNTERHGYTYNDIVERSGNNIGKVLEGGQHNEN